MNDLDSKGNLNDAVTFSKGTVLMVEGEASNYLYLVKKGAIKTFKKDGHKLTVVGIIREKGFVGELSVFTTGTRNMSAITIEDSEVFLIKQTEIQKVLGDCPDWVTNIMSTISERLISSREMLIEHSIINDLYDNDLELSIAEEKEFIKLLDDYCERRGILT